MDDSVICAVCHEWVMLISATEVGENESPDGIGMVPVYICDACEENIEENTETD